MRYLAQISTRRFPCHLQGNERKKRCVILHKSVQGVFHATCKEMNVKNDALSCTNQYKYVLHFKSKSDIHVVQLADQIVVQG